MARDIVDAALEQRLVVLFRAERQTVPQRADLVDRMLAPGRTEGL